ncbi:endonuclease/exonuclease/phosphatase family protein [Nannocystaceae bacterium ST9]
MPRRVVLGVLALLSACPSACAREVEAGGEPSEGESSEIVLLSYNVNYGLAGDLAAIQAIVESDADLVLLQETTPEWELALRDSSSIADRWPHLRFHHCCGAGGLALLSRWPIADFEILEPPSEPDAWFPAARAVVETPAGPIELLDVHLRPPVATADQGWLSALSSTPAVRQAEVQHYVPALAPELPTVIAGDFNEGDDGRALRRLREAGFVDVLAHLKVRGHTWRWGGLRARLDHVLVDEHFEPIAAEIVDAGRSDHLPLRARLRLQ